MQNRRSIYPLFEPSVNVALMSQETSLQDPLRFNRKTPACAVVIYGANGDLTKRKLMPALYRLAYEGRLAPGFAVVGISRTAMTNDEFRDRMHDSVKKFLEDSPFDEDLWRSFAQGVFYLAGDVGAAASFGELGRCLAEVQEARKTEGNVLFYLSTQPSQYAQIAEGLAAAQLNHGDGWRRIVIEKPFGRDLDSARALNGRLQKCFHENEVYRIDHYLGKETVQNIIAFRFGNGIFEPLWNRRYVNHVQITAAESIGVEGRGGYYQEAGALRDMVQNHLLQVTATMTMEPAAVFEPDAVRDERAKLLRSIKIMRPEDVPRYSVAGQYRGFREEPGVNPESQTDTYAAVTFFIDNWRWAGVPFYIRTGKKLPKRVTDIAIQYNDAPHALFESGTDGTSMHPNLLIVRIQPEEGISLRFLSKQPGSGMRLRPVSMDFNYGSSFGERSPSAYETLLVDAMQGDATLYTRQDMVEASWRAVQPILDDWGSRTFTFPNYEPGTWGPAEADLMLARNGHHWRNS
jgi:glucose-6-phosphate 1-dehydrogenase